VIVSFLSVILGIVKGKNETNRLFPVLLFLISLRMLAAMHTVPWGYTVESDSSYSLQLSNLIHTTGRWAPGMGLGVEAEYSFYPGLNIWTAMLTEISCLDTANFARFIYPALSGSLVLVFYYLAIRSVLREKVAIWATLILCLNQIFVFFDGYYIHESFGLVFFSIFLMCLFYAFSKKTTYAGFVLVGILSIFCTTISHHWSSYNLLIVSTVFLVLPALTAYLFNLRRQGVSRLAKSPMLSLSFVVLIFSIVLAWALLVAFRIFDYHILWSYQFAESVLNPLSSGHPSLTLRYFTFLERALIIAGTAVLVALGIKGLIGTLVKKEKNRHDALLVSWFVFCAAYIVSFSYFSPSFFGALSISKRAWTFAFFGLSPLIAVAIVNERVGFNRILKRRFPKNLLSVVLSLLLIFPLVAAILQAPLVIHNPSYFLPGDSYHSTITWIEQHAQNETLTVDAYSRVALIPYVRLNFQLIENSTGDSGIVLYRSGDLAYILPHGAKVIVFSKNLGEIYNWYPNVSSDPSELERYANKIHDSVTTSIYILEMESGK